MLFIFLCLSFLMWKTEIKIKQALTQHRPYPTSQVQPSLTQGGYKAQTREDVYEMALKVVNGDINQIILVIVEIYEALTVCHRLT